MKRRVYFSNVPKEPRKVTVSFTVNGRRITFTKSQKVPKPIHIEWSRRVR